MNIATVFDLQVIFYSDYQVVVNAFLKGFVYYLFALLILVINSVILFLGYLLSFALIASAICCHTNRALVHRLGEILASSKNISLAFLSGKSSLN